VPTLTIDTPGGPATVELTRPRNPQALVLLTHGAGGPVHTVDLLAIRDGLTAAGIAVGLVTQAYVVAGRHTPPVPLKQDESWLVAVAAVGAVRGMKTLPLVLGGRSNGARVACRTALAAGATAVVALAFPLHPPGRPEKTRIDELEAAGVPTLVVQGARDAFGMPPPASTRELVVIPAADHSLKRNPQAVVAAVITFVTSQIGHARVES
jgi:predicted alpha/beta-hydrolase family hydrolase